MEIGYCYAKEFYQECFLAIDHYGHGRLHFIRSGNVETIGQYQACSPGTTDAWTEILATGECFTFV